MKNGKLIMLSLILGLYSSSFSEKTKGTVFLETNYLKMKEKKSKIKNRNFQLEQHFVNIWKNKSPIYDVKEYNEVGTINVDKDSIGLFATGNGVKISNNGIIQIDNGGIGMSTINSAQMENGINGQINLNGNNSVGMLSNSGIIGINKGKINLSGGNNFTQVGMASIDGGNSINKGDITVSNDNSYGMVAKKGNITNEQNIIVKDGFSGIGMEVQLNFDKGINNGNIIIENTDNARGMVSAKGGESINNGEIILKNSKNSYGMNIGDGASLSNKETSIINNGNITLDKDGKNNVAIRVFEEQGHTITNGLGINKKNINVSGSDSYGMYGKGENVTLKNEGTIKLNKDFNPNNNNGVIENHNIGIYITGNASAENTANSIIEITEGSKNSFGMVSLLGKNLLNKGSILINSNEKERNVGMQGVGAEAKNLGNIFINGNHGVGMTSANGSSGEKGEAINEGKITIAKNVVDGRGMISDTGSIITNKGIIEVSGTGFGMSNQLDKHSDVEIRNNGVINLESTSTSSGDTIGINGTNKTKISNKGTIIIIGNKLIGIQAKNSSSVITGTESEITIKGNNNKAIIGYDNSKIENKGKINIIGKSNHGISLDGNSTLFNSGNIEINGSRNNGITIKNKSSFDGEIFNVNEGEVVILGGSNTGIAIENSSLKTTGKITLSGTYGFGIDSFKGQIFNGGEVVILGEENVGIETSESLLNNTGKITLSGTYGFGIDSSKGQIFNGGEVVILGENNVGFSINKYSSLKNTGKIIITGEGKNVGISSAHSEVFNEGEIEISEKNNVGIQIASTSLKNIGKITITGEGNKGIFAVDTNSKVFNEGEIKISDKNNIGFSISQYSSLKNTGKITITGEGNKGIFVEKQTEELKKKTEVFNEGEIEISGKNNIGIEVEKGGLLKNTGKITITGEGNKGIFAKNKTEVFNEGEIKISGKNNIGIEVEKGGLLKNTGKIIIEGQIYNGSVTTSIGSNGNKAIVNYGGILNEGTIVSNGEFNTNSMGTGKFTMEKDSTLEAKKIKGDIYLSSGITTGSLKNTYETNKMFDTEDMKANLLSSSLLFNSKLVNNNGTQYGAILERRNFNEVISDSSLANYLENNYVDTNNPLKVSLYDKYKNVSNQREMNDLVDDTFGKTLFPALEKQNFEVIRLNNNILKNNVSKLSIKDDFKYIVGGAYNRIDTDSTEKVQGYNLSLKNIWLGGEKRIDDYKKVGIVLSLGEHHSNFTDNSHREDKTFDGTIFANYNKDNLNMRTFATLGKMNTDLRREAESFNTNFDSKLKNKYFVLSNEISQKFNFEKGIYVTPKASLNFYKLSQDKLEEKNNKYGLEIDKAKSFIIESGVGLSVGKDTILPNEYTLNTELEVSYFNRHRDTNDLKGRLSSISDDTFELENYKLDRNIGSGKLKISLEKDEWNVYTSYEARFEKDLNSIATLGIIYRF